MKTILLTNDDGFYSPGIQTLRQRLEKKHRVVLVAPDREKSAISMALTLNHPLRLKKVESGVYAVDGTTSDCINLAIQDILPQAPDFIVSGMNLGENLAEDIFFSGTVGGAFSGFLFGVPALAVSLIPDRNRNNEEEYDFSAGAAISESILEALLEYPDRQQVFNVNIPFPNNGRIMVTSLGHKRYKPDILKRRDPHGRSYYWIGTGTPDYAGSEGTDIWAVRQGNISLSVVKYDLNSVPETDRLRRYIHRD
jgi:5'-nucleotidase